MKKCFLLASWSALVIILVAGATASADIATPFNPGKVGDEALAFRLPSSQGKLVDYYRDYYGKHHLVMTFFPAAFTPV